MAEENGDLQPIGWTVKTEFGTSIEQNVADLSAGYGVADLECVETEFKKDDPRTGKLITTPPEPPSLEEAKKAALLATLADDKATDSDKIAALTAAVKELLG